MTPQRKEYLANISKEERLAREAIKRYKDEIARINKNTGLFCHFLTTKDISDRKKTISLLKKHLSMKVLKHTVIFGKGEKFTGEYCPHCHLIIVKAKRFCNICGQRLRWKE